MLENTNAQLKPKFFLQTYNINAKTKSLSVATWDNEFNLDINTELGETLKNLLGLFPTQPILVNSNENKAILKSQANQILPNEQYTLVIYFPITHETTRENLKDQVRAFFDNNLKQFQGKKEIGFHVIASELPFEAFAEKVSTNFTKAGMLVVEKNQNVPTLKEEKSAGFPWGKLALFLLVIGALGVGGLAIAGLFFSLWTIAPAVPLLIGIFFGIKAIYDKFHRPFRDRFKGTSLNPESHTPWSDINKPKNVNTQDQSFITGKNPAPEPVQNPEAMQKAAKAKAIIIGKVNEFVNHTNELTITNKGTSREFSLTIVEECFRYMESDLTIVEEEGGNYVLRWDVMVPSEVIPKPPSEELSSAIELLSSNIVHDKLFLITNVINSCLGGDGFAVCDRFSLQPRTRIKYPNAVFITSDSIDEIIHKYPDPIKTHHNH